MKEIIKEFLSNIFGYEGDAAVEELVELLQEEREEALGEEYLLGRTDGLNECQEEYDNGFSDGEKSGYDSGYDDGYADGFVKGQDSIE